MPLETQIRAAYRSGATVEEIADQLQCHPTAVKATLADTEEFTDEDARAMAGVIKNIALSGDNERNRLTAAMYVYDVKKGYRVNRQDTPTVTAVQINQLINAANLDIQKLIGTPSGVGTRQTVVIQSENQGQQPREDQAPVGGNLSEGGGGTNSQ